MSEGNQPAKRRPRDVKLGVTIGFYGAILYCALALLIWVLDHEGLRAEGLSLVALLLYYLLSGLVGGALLGVLFPWTTHRAGSIVVGILAFSPAAVGAGIVTDGLPWNWTGAGWFGTVMTALLLGGWCGFYFWTPVGAEDASDEWTGSLPRQEQQGA